MKSSSVSVAAISSGVGAGGGAGGSGAVGWTGNDASSMDASRSSDWRATASSPVAAGTEPRLIPAISQQRRSEKFEQRLRTSAV